MESRNETYIEKLKNILLSDENVCFSLVFGSLLEKEKFRDIDIAIYFKETPKGLEFLKYATELDKKVEYETHIVALNEASPFMRHQVMKTGKLLFVRDYSAFWNFRERTIDDYQEYKHISGMDIYD